MTVFLQEVAGQSRENLVAPRFPPRETPESDPTSTQAASRPRRPVRVLHWPRVLAQAPPIGNYLALEVGCNCPDTSGVFCFMLSVNLRQPAPMVVPSSQVCRI